MATARPPISMTKTKVAFSPARPATHDQAGFDALTWTVAHSVVSVGDIGATRSVGSIKTLDDGTYKPIGQRDLGNATVDFLYVSDDDGQIAIAAAEKATTLGSLRITYVTGEIRYYAVGVSKAIVGHGADGKEVMLKTEFPISGDEVIVAAP